MYAKQLLVTLKKIENLFEFSRLEIFDFSYDFNGVEDNHRSSSGK